MKKRQIKGYTVFYNEDSVEGANYLDHDLDYKEAEVFFRAARERGSVDFEDDNDRDFTLKRNSDGTYTLIRRKSSGWFF